MSDKSFGDHMSRGIMKNPLLSTAVTGLSIEDLTQNAVLLPVSRTQELFGRQEPETPVQFTPTPSGDTFTPIQPPEQNANKDDFDVNEYFARLQGTCYVSAPINSHIDNIEKEENLEEINLNEPEDIQLQALQQSFTADIAQNFSQLPAVLPQVASAVFSSFSHMLMKRETPVRETQAQVVETQGKEMQVPLVGVSEMVAPPMREPPTSGPGNFRLTTKKKYAQIPGLSSGESAQRPTYTLPTFNQPIFTPPEKDNFINTENSIPTLDAGQTNVDFNAFSNKHNIPDSNNKTNVFEAPKEVIATSQITQDSNPQAIIPPPPMFSNLAKKDSVPNVGKTILPPSVARRIGSNKPTISNQAPAFTAVGNIFVPAPIEGESLPQNAPQTSFVDRSNLATSFPSSFTSQPAPMSTPYPPMNTVSSTGAPPPAPTSLTVTMPLSSGASQTDSPITVPTAPTGIPRSTMGSLPSVQTTFTAPSVSLAPESSIMGNLPPALKNAFGSPPEIDSQAADTSVIGNLPPPPKNVFTIPPGKASSASSISSNAPPSVSLPPQLFTRGSQQRSVAPPPICIGSQATPNIPPAMNIPLNPNAASVNSLSAQPQMSNSYLQNQSTSELSAQIAFSPVAPQIFNPNQRVSLLATDDQRDQLAHLLPPVAEPPKIPEPPRASGNTNFRMTKKRPQYYSGPIEGVGSISNNVKPTLTPVASTSFQGSVFTPETNTASVFTPENVTTNAATSHNAILPPENVNESQPQFSNFSPVYVNQPSSNIDFSASEAASSNYTYNTTFDLSRQAPGTYEPPKQDSAFGIIGSLKSKLSSIDINKLQNSVTTFFDPGYNMVKTGTAENTQPTYGQNQGFEIFVANPETQEQPYNYDAHQNNFTYGQGSIPNASDYYNQQVHNVYSTNSYYSQPTYGTQSYSRTEIPAQQIYSQQPNIPTPTVTETQGVNPWDSYNPTNIGNHKDNVKNDNHFTYEVIAAIDTENTLRANEWSTSENTSKSDDKDSAGDNRNVYLTTAPTTDIDSSQSANVSRSHDGSRPSYDKNNLADSSNITHGQISTLTTDPLQKTDEWITYNSPSTSCGFDNVAQNSSISQEPTSAVNAKTTQNANIWGTYDSTSSGYDKDVVEHKTDHIGAFLHSQQESNVPKTVEMPSAENMTEAMKTLHIKDDGKENLEEIGLVEEENAPDNDMSQSHITSPYFDENGELKKSVLFNYVDLLSGTPMPEVSNVLYLPFRAPLAKIQDTSDRVSEGAVSWNSDEEEVDDQSAAERLLDLVNEDSDDENLRAYESEQAENLDICETCREVIPHEEQDGDLTHKLIKNITAPIQLSNPVEVPLTETNITRSVPDAFDQCAEISLIADETIETLQIQSATELLNETENTNIETNYGWRAEGPLPPGEDLLDHDYTFKTDPKALGLFANNNLFFDNLPTYDGIKTELNAPQKTPIALQSQISIPSAPPAEDLDDAQSDETGVLDVQSIEQDASKDFPVFEEYVIEPSETDDDKIEFKTKNDEVKDTFTNRVDRFKKLEGNDDAIEQKDSANLIASNTMMPSYFDTGNYAAEAHFKNSLTSPTVGRIPPGFEDHYELVPRDVNQQHETRKIPDTTTQTTLTTTVSDVPTKTKNLTSTVFSNMTSISNEPTNLQEPQSVKKLPNFTSVFGAKTEFADANVTKAETAIELKTDIPSLNPQVNVEDKKENEAVTLPDPMNFFASATQEPVTTEGVNRLASYFAAPAKNTNTKSFFELSQGQDHYRQNEEIKSSKPCFDLSQSQDHYKENVTNIPHDRYIANFNLMNDLTSCQNIEPKKEQIVKTINYFTVEYDNDNLNLNKGEPSLLKQVLKETLKPIIKKEIEVEKDEANDEMVTKIINKCKYCNLNASPVIRKDISVVKDSQVKFRQVMDGATNPKKGEVNMDPGREKERTVNVRMEDMASDGDNSEGVAMMNENRSSNEYEPVKYHWFYRVDCEDKSTWRGFSVTDSRAIENAFQSPTLTESTLVPTDGGRYDVNVVGRLRISVYWSDKPTNVRRCSWFYKGTTDARYVPYTEAVAEKLEVEYRHGMTTGEWHRRLVLPNSELVVMHGPAVMVHFLQGGATDAFGAPNLFTFSKRVYRNPPKFKVSVDQPAKIDHLLLLVHGAGEWKHQREKIQSTMRPRVVRRGTDESEIEDMEPSSIDHLLLLCHGVGSACDMRFRAVEEVVDDFRATSLQLLQSHYRNSFDNGTVGRVEVLPISWHASLHSGPRGVDRRLARVTLASIPRLRNFTNDTVLDVLFYTSPHYCQLILDTVCSELNRVYTLFMARNPDFKGQVSLGGHSLGSVILYDLLCNQPIPRNPVKARSEKTYISGTAANNPIMQYPILCFEPLALYALGSPIAIFECIRGVDMLGDEFYLPTCRNFFNIFHPYDPIAYRIEPLVNPKLQDVKPSLIPHHKGRKRMHLELKDTMARVGADLKQKLVESIKNTWSSMWSTAAPPDHQLEKVVEEEIEKEQLEEEICKEEPVQADVAPGEMLGRLNNGRRVDYVLQEAPFEMINEYIFAMTSHVCYWESEDVMLLILREIYDSMGIQPDVTVPQQSMTVQRTTIVTTGETVVATDASTSRIS